MLGWIRIEIAAYLYDQDEINRNDILVVEKAGRSLKSMLHYFKPRICGRTLYSICETEKTGPCDKSGVKYVKTYVGYKNSGKTGEYHGKYLKTYVREGDNVKMNTENKKRIL